MTFAEKSNRRALRNPAVTAMAAVLLRKTISSRRRLPDPTNTPRCTRLWAKRVLVITTAGPRTLEGTKIERIGPDPRLSAKRQPDIVTLLGAKLSKLVATTKPASEL